MTTSISSEARRNQTSILIIQAEKITFPPKPDRQTYGRTDISIYRASIASLLKMTKRYKTGSKCLDHVSSLFNIPLLHL